MVGKCRPAERQPRAEQREATRRALLEAGAKAFAAKGHDGVNLAKDILDPEGISVGSFYHQFANKTELLLAIIERAAKRGQTLIEATLPPEEAGADPEAVRATWEASLSLVDLREDLVRIQLRERHSPHPEIAEAIRNLDDLRLSDLRARYQAITKPGVTVDTDSTTDMLSALAVGALTSYLHTPRSQRPRRKAQLVDRLTTMTLAGAPGFVQNQDNIKADQ